jgi:formylglycine-generating enzyme required for sulfatase activity/uncharacterized caspase-like protein
MLRKITVLAILLLALAPLLAAQSRGLSIIGKDGSQLGSFKASYALVIGETQYSAGWPKLPGVANDARLVQEALAAAGFSVTLKQDLPFDEMKSAYEDFIDAYGLDEGNRLLFYYAGHGHTLKLAGGRDMGYIVPIDAPNPNVDPNGFKRRAIPMQQFDTWAKAIEARHAMFLFDSCFSGSIFNVTRAVPDNINEKTVKAVRQFITSGSADETVPDKSIFRDQFLEGIAGEADRNADGYVTGAELGEFLDERVVNYSRKSQHPQYGKIQDPALDKGDFVFAVAAKAAVVPQSAQSASPTMTVIPKVAPTITITRAYGSLSVSAVTAGALYLDGVKQGDLPAGATATLGNIEVGDRSVELRYPEGSLETRSVSVTEGKATVVGFVWKKATGQVPSGTTLAPAAAGTAQRDFVSVAGGTFTMGSPTTQAGSGSDEAPQHKVTLSAYSIGKYEVTFDEYDAYCAATGTAKPGDNGWGRGMRPVVNVSWYEAAAYCNWRSKWEGLSLAYAISGTGVSFNKGASGYRLPTEAEWEYAARGSSQGSALKMKYPGSDTLDTVAWYSGNAGSQSHPVGGKAPNALGLFDMSGNVWEWCNDWYERYESGTKVDPAGAASGAGRVLRGGCWGDVAGRCTVSSRGYWNPGGGRGDIGFRVVRRP